jgi:KaiC/GvpD/RAD55 family RecA-like ATPase
VKPPKPIKSKDVFPGSKKLVKGELPPQSFLLIGPSGIGKTIFCKQFIYNGLAKGESCIYLSTDESPKRIHKSMKEFGFNISNDLDQSTFRIIDCYSWKLGGKSSSEFAVTNPTDLTSIARSIENAWKDLGKIRLVLDSITGLISLSNHHQVYFSKFLQSIVAKIRRLDGNAIFTVAPEAHNQQFLSFLRLAFDGTLEMKTDETGKELKRLLRVFSLRGANHKTNWTPFEITNNGIILKNEKGLRCDMCSRQIEWEPITEIVEGKEYNFDCQDCAKTYKKFKSLYNGAFE